MSLYHYFRSLILPLNEIDRLLPKRGRLVDLGCDGGVIAQKLIAVKTRFVIGVDKDAKRFPRSSAKNLKFVHADILKFDLNYFEGAVISDVLHHLKYNDQKKLLNKIFKALKQRGVLVIKEIDTGEFIRARLSRLWDFIFYPNDKIYYWQAKNLKRFLENLGFKVRIIRPIRLFPGSTTLFICKK